MKTALRSWKSLGVVTASTATSAILTLAVTLVAVALLEKSEFGHFIFFIGVSTFVGGFLDLGVTLQMLMEYSTGSRGDRDPVIARHWSAQLWSYGTGTLLAIAVTIPVGAYFHVPDLVVALGALNGAFVGLFNFVISVLQVRQEWTGRARVIILQAFVRAPVVVVGLAFGSAISGAIGAVIGAGLGLALALRHPVVVPLRGSLRYVTGIAAAWRTWIRSRWFMVLIAATASVQYVPVAWVGRIGGSEALASFGLASQLAAGPALAMLSIMIFLQPSGSDPSVSMADYAALAKRSVAPVLGLFVIAAVAAPFLIPPVFGSEFSGAVVPFELLLVATAVSTAASPLQILYLRLADPRGWAVMEIVGILGLIAGLIFFSRSLSVPVAAGAAAALAAVVSRTVGLARLMRMRHRLQAPKQGDSTPNEP